MSERGAKALFCIGVCEWVCQALSNEMQTGESSESVHLSLAFAKALRHFTAVKTANNICVPQGAGRVRR